MSPSVTRVFTMELCVKIGNILTVRFGVQLIVDIEVLTMGCIAFVDEFNPRAAVKRHLQVAVECAACIECVVLVRGGGERNRIVRVNDFVAETEEVAQWTEDTRVFLIVPEHPDQDVSIPVRLGHPDMIDTPGALDVCNNAGFTGFDIPCIVIPACSVPRSGA